MKRALAIALFSLILASLLSAQAVPRGVRVSSSVMSGLLTTQVAPTYPPLARQARIEGKVVLHIQVGKTGDVANIQLVSGHPMLAPAAIDAVRKWKYRPYLLNAEPVEVDTEVTVAFALDDDPIPDTPPSDNSSTKDAQTATGTPSEPHPLIPVPTRVRVSQGVQQGLLIRKVAPIYPAAAREAHIQGLVTLKVEIDTEGNVANLWLISGHPDLAPAAMDAVKQWKYRPYLLNRKPVDVETQVQVNFTLAP